ncbi:MAG: AI-2E family transporter [Candidatus Solibacter sp.]|nr:AI-2E family transporter [Candidatus Solibacter sp.]
MLGIERSAARYTWTAAMVVLLLWLVYLLRSTLFVFALALLFAYLLSPLVDLLDRAIPRKGTRTLALALSYVIFIGVIVLIGIQIGTRVVSQAQTLASRLPDMMAKVEQPSDIAPAGLNSLKAQLVASLRTNWAQRSSDIMRELPSAGLKFLSAASNLIYVVIVPVLAFFFLKDGDVIRSNLLDIVDVGPLRDVVGSVMAHIHLLLAHSMRALVLLSLATFTAYAIFFTIMGVPFGVLLAVVAMALEFIPMIGPLMAIAVILLVTLVAGAHFWAVVIFIVAYRMFQDYFLSPHLMGQGVELHPLLVLLGVFGGAEVAGVAGSFLSVPVLAMARILYVRTRRSRLSVAEATSVLTR